MGFGGLKRPKGPRRNCRKQPPLPDRRGHHMGWEVSEFKGSEERLCPAEPVLRGGGTDWLVLAHLREGVKVDLGKVRRKSLKTETSCHWNKCYR